MHHHDVVDIVAGSFDPVIKLAQFASGLIVGDGGDPGHGERLSVGGVGDRRRYESALS